MNIMMTAAGVGRESYHGGSGEDAFFVATLCAAGFLLLTAAHLIMRRFDRPQAAVVRWTDYSR